MGTKVLTDFAKQGVEGFPETDHEPVPLPKGSRDEHWLKLVNQRIKRKDGYQVLKRRGGTSALATISAGNNIISLKEFSSQISGVVTDYIAVQVSTGAIFLYDIDADSASEIATGFSTTTPVQVIPNNRFIYIFDYDYGSAKYHDLLTGNTYDWLSYTYNYIYNHTWTGADSLSSYKENPFDFLEGQKAICFPNYKDIGADISLDGSLSESEYATRIYQYNYNSGKYIVDADGKEYKSDQIIIISTGETFTYTIAGSGSDPVISILYVPLKGNEVYYKSFIVTIETVNGNSIIFAPDDSSIDMPKTISHFGSSPTDGQPVLIPYNAYLEEAYNGKPALYKTSTTTVIENPAYIEPVFYKSFVIVDLLDDGSFTLPGKPYLISLSASDLYDETIDAKRIALSINNYDSDQVSKRYLYATKWLDNTNDVYSPSSEKFPSNAYYLDDSEEIVKNLYRFTKPDRLLIEPMAGRVPISAGIPVYFGTNQLTVNSIEQFGGAALIGGYQINRPVPSPYTNPQTADLNNIYAHVIATSQLPEDVALAFMFEYTDGKRSEIVETEEFLQEGSTSDSTTISDCGQTESKATVSVTGGATEDGDLEVTFDFSSVDIDPYGTGLFVVTVSLLLSSHAGASDVAIAIADQLNLDASFSDYFVATVESSTNVVVSCIAYGLDLDDISVDIDPVLVAATGAINVTANNIPGAGSENHTIDVGANSTDPFTINDTDTVEGIVDKYVSEINGNLAIEADWTASKVDLGGGEWQCLITSDSPGSAANGVTIDVTGDTDVVMTIDSPTSGGSDGPGVTFDATPVVTAGADNPAGTPAEVSVSLASNFLNDPSQSFELTIDGVVYASFNVLRGQTSAEILESIETAFSGANWTAAKESYDGALVITANDAGNTAFNDLPVAIQVPDAAVSEVFFTLTAPGRDSVSSGNGQEILTNGAGEACAPADVTLEPTANDIGTTEDYDIALDGVTFFSQTINSTDTLNEIALAIQTAARENADINEVWQVELSSNVLTFTHRTYGTSGNDKSFTITPAGTGDVTFSDGSPSAGGTDTGDEIPSGSAETVSVNRVMIHSLNALVSKVFILGRVINGSTTYHLLDEVSISDPQAHGLYVDLPNASSDLTDILSTVFTPPAADEILINPVLQDHYAAALPIQQILINSQEQIADNSAIQCMLKDAFDIDKSTMRYKFWVFTDQNTQYGYLVEQTVSINDSGQVFTQYDSDFEIISEKLVIRSKFAKAKIKGSSFVQATDGVYILDNLERPLIDNGDEPIIADNLLKNILYNEEGNEIWFVSASNHVFVYDLEYKSVREYDYSALSSRDLKTAVSYKNKVYAAFDDYLALADDSSLNSDFTTNEITGQAILKHIGTPLTKAKIMEVVVGGVNEKAQIEVDLQQSRLERNQSIWSTTFNADYTSAVKNLFIHGSSYQVFKTGVMPKVKIITSGATPVSGFISHILIKYVLLDNKGKARI